MAKPEPFVRTSRSNAPVRSIALVSAIVDYVRCQHWPDEADRVFIRGEILRIARAVWPNADIYVGDTHFRLRLDGHSDNHGGTSVYVDWENDGATAWTL